MPPVRDDAIQLRDGRELAYAEWGDPEGTIVFFFHGTPHSRLWCPDESATTSLKVRLITVDRPGIGGSDVLPRRTFAAWPSDVVELAEALHVDTFAVVGWSAGGPYAAACAALIPERISGVGIACSRHLSQWNVAEKAAAYGELDADERRIFDLAQRDPDAAARAAADDDREWIEALWKQPDTLFDSYENSDGDLWIFEDEQCGRDFLEAARESVRQGPEAFAWERNDVWLPWGFRAADVATEVHVWHGDQDTLVERRHIDFIVELLPNARLTVWNDSGHLGVARHWNEVLEAVT
ncbi:MAG: alpha/beta fold hydrolase [Gaiellaceae bacterium]